LLFIFYHYFFLLNRLIAINPINAEHSSIADGGIGTSGVSSLINSGMSTRKKYPSPNDGFGITGKWFISVMQDGIVSFSNV